MKISVAIAIAVTTLAARDARSDGDAAPPTQPPPAAAKDDNAEPTAPQALTDADLLEMAQQETIEIYDERPDKPFDRDTEVRLTGEQLAARGAVDLGTALALLPDVTVRDAGRGGTNIDIRGARKGAVSIFIDGVLVSDPYYGTFDVSSIPITDIVQIRVSTTPQSPIDGPGGPGGVVEVHTRDAIGQQLVIARATASTLPSAGVTATARVATSEHTALRVSASGLAGGQSFTLPPGQAREGSLDSQQNDAAGAARFEYRDGERRLAVDGFVDNRHYISPPDEEMPQAILVVDREANERADARFDDKIDKLQVQAEGFVDHLYRRSRYFIDPALTDETILEDLSALRTGGFALVTHPIGKDARWAASVEVEHDSVRVADLANNVTNAELTILEAAGDIQYERGTVRLDGSGGIAAPTGLGVNPWPEGKAVARWRPNYGWLELTATLARKGRAPSLRERFDPTTGNPNLGPEMIDHAEVRAIAQATDKFRVEAAPYYKYSTGTIRASTNPADIMKLVNLGSLAYYGVDLIARYRVIPMVEVGGAYSYEKVTQLATSTTPEVDDPLDRLPRNRGEAWAQVFPAIGYAVLARVRYFGPSWDTGVRVPGYTDVEANVTAQVTKQYLIVGHVEDVLGTQIETRNGYYTPGRVISVILQGQW